MRIVCDCPRGEAWRAKAYACPPFMTVLWQHGYVHCFPEEEMDSKVEHFWRKQQFCSMFDLKRWEYVVYWLLNDIAKNSKSVQWRSRHCIQPRSGFSGRFVGILRSEFGTSALLPPVGFHDPGRRKARTGNPPAPKDQRFLPQDHCHVRQSAAIPQRRRIPDRQPARFSEGAGSPGPLSWGRKAFQALFHRHTHSNSRPLGFSVQNCTVYSLFPERRVKIAMEYAIQKNINLFNVFTARFSCHAASRKLCSARSNNRRTSKKETS